MSDDLQQAALRRGIEVMTAWLEAKPGVGPEELMWEILWANIDEGEQGLAETMMGLQALAAILLVKLRVATGQQESEILQEVARSRLN